MQNRLYVYWINTEEDECVTIGPDTLCICTHRYCQLLFVSAYFLQVVAIYPDFASLFCFKSVTVTVHWKQHSKNTYCLGILSIVVLWRCILYFSFPFYYNSYFQHNSDTPESPEEGPVFIPCSEEGCGCNNFYYTPKVGTPFAKCACRHIISQHNVTLPPFRCDEGNDQQQEFSHNMLKLAHLF